MAKEQIKPTAPLPQNEEVQELVFTITEGKVNVILNALSKLSWQQADPIIKFLQEALTQAK